MSQSRTFFTSNTRIAFIKLKQAFIKVPILNHFDPKYPIRIETNALGYTIDEIFNQLTSDNAIRWHLVVFFSQKMILLKNSIETTMVSC